jgi:hypothetical protein
MRDHLSVAYGAFDPAHRDLDLEHFLIMQAIDRCAQRRVPALSLGMDTNRYGHHLPFGLPAYKLRIGFTPLAWEPAGRELVKFQRFDLFEKGLFFYSYEGRGIVGNLFTRGSPLRPFRLTTTPRRSGPTGFRRERRRRLLRRRSLSDRAHPLHPSGDPGRGRRARGSVPRPGPLRVLEIGCGDGGSLLPMASGLPGGICRHRAVGAGPRAANDAAEPSGRNVSFQKKASRASMRASGRSTTSSPTASSRGCRPTSRRRSSRSRAGCSGPTGWRT